MARSVPRSLRSLPWLLAALLSLACLPAPVRAGDHTLPGLQLARSSEAVSDSLLGERLRTCVLLTNAGTANAASVRLSDLPPGPAIYVPGTLRSGPACATATTAEDDDDAGPDDSDGLAASSTYGTIHAVVAAIPPGGSAALTYEAILD